jgi:hypothetical protein
MEPPPIIHTNDLTLRHVPLPNAAWKALAAFALTFDPIELTGQHGDKAADLSNADEGSSLVELRAHLYVEQRRWNHFGREPDSVTMSKLRSIVVLVRSRLAGT